MSQVPSVLVSAFAIVFRGIQTHILGPASDRDRSAGPFLRFLWNRFVRVEHRLLALYAKFQAGTLPQAKERNPLSHRDRAAKRIDGGARETPVCDPQAKPKPLFTVPRRKAWLWMLAHPQSNAPRAALERLLASPDLEAFVQAAPQAGRLLRPLVRAMGLPLPDLLKLPPKPCKPKRKPRKRKPRARRLWKPAPYSDEYRPSIIVPILGTGRTRV